MNIVFRIYVFLLAIGGFFNGPASAEILTGALLSGSDRLVNFSSALSMEQSPNVMALQSFVATSARLSFNVSDPENSNSGFYGKFFNVRPSVYYDENANGGNKSERLSLGNGSYFSFSRETLAQSALMIGANVELGGKYTYDRGRYLDLSIEIGHAVSAQNGLQQSKASYSLCSRNHVVGWTYVDLCSLGSIFDKDLSSSRNVRNSIDLVHLAEIRDAAIEWKISSFSKRSSDEPYYGVGFSSLVSLSDGIYYQLGIEKGFVSDFQEGTNFLLWSGIGGEIWGRRVQINFSQSEELGEQLLGYNRVDAVSTLSLSVGVRPNASLTAWMNSTSSSIEFYDDNSFGLSLSLPKF